MIELRNAYWPNSIWGRLRLWRHRTVKQCAISIHASKYGGVVVFDDTCRAAWRA